MALLTEEPPLQSASEKTNENTDFVKIKNHIDNTLDKSLANASRFNILASISNIFVKTKETVCFCKDNAFGINVARNFLISNKILPHIALVVLAFIVIFSNISDHRAVQAFYKELVYIDPINEEQIVESIGYFTPLIEDDQEISNKASEALASADGFISNAGTVTTELTSREEPLPDNSQSTVKYLVRSGDTLTGLGWKFGVKLATLKYVNEIDNINTIKPGTELKIPQRGYEVPASQIAKREQERQAKLAAASRKTITRNGITARAASSSEDLSTGGGNLAVPISHNGVSQGFSGRHTGVDYRADIGTTVYAADGGTVMAVTGGWSGGYGLQVLVNHGNGVVTRYAHLSSVSVSVGESVGKGEAIARSGNSGRSTGPHLHFEKIVNGRQIRPF